jgi:hypothetical protein
VTNLLLEGLPPLEAKAKALTQLRSPAGEARRIFRQFRKEMPTVHQHLRHLKAQRGGQLTLTEILRSADRDSDYTGPAGFRGRGRGEVETRDIEFGFVAGQSALEKDFNPIKELDDTIRRLDSFDLRPTDEQALELAAEWEGDEKRRKAAVAILQMVDRDYARITNKLADFWSFFTISNI